MNGLNQQSGISNATTSTSVSFTHDGRGNITAIGAGGYTYSAENLLRTGPGSTSLSYDPLGRLYEVSDGSTTTRFQYDGGQIAAEYNASNTRLRRYVPGPGQPAPAEAGEPAFWYEGSGIGPAIWYHSDERGSVIALSNQTSVVAINSYDAYGKPASGNLGRFGYTGQAWLPELGMWTYKARIYNPANNVARFMQADPIGYGSGMNIYAYVGGDPVNFTDPSGLRKESEDEVSDASGWEGSDVTSNGGPIIATACGGRPRFKKACVTDGGILSGGGGSSSSPGGQNTGGEGAGSSPLPCTGAPCGLPPAPPCKAPLQCGPVSPPKPPNPAKLPARKLTKHEIACRSAQQKLDIAEALGYGASTAAGVGEVRKIPTGKTAGLFGLFMGGYLYATGSAFFALGDCGK